MKRRRFFPVFFIVSISLLPVFPALLYAQPSVSFDKESMNFGRMESGAPVSGTFTITNTGDQPLLIKGLKPGWGCTAALVSSTTILPGQKAAIVVNINTHGKSGYIAKDVLVTTNDPKRPYVNISMEGFIQPAGDKGQDTNE